MSGLGDGIGIAIEGGLLGGAVEPEHGAASSTAHGTTECPNCGAKFSSQYCPDCGQKAHVHRSLAAMGHDLMHGVLHLDGKLWNTLPLLTLKPGELTRRYIAGERAKFVSPMAMFLFSVFAMFAVFQMVGISAPTDFATDVLGPDLNNPMQSAVREQIAKLEKERGTIPEDNARRNAIDSELAGLNLLRPDGNSTLPENDYLTFSATGIEWLDEGLIKKWKNNPGLMLYKLQSNGYKFSWLLIPLSIPFLGLVFAWRRQFKTYDHAVFVTYSLAFMSLLFIAMSILIMVPEGGGLAFLLFSIAAPVHLYKQLRYAYGLTRFSALWRFALLVVFIQIVVMLFLQALLVLGAF